MKDKNNPKATDCEYVKILFKSLVNKEFDLVYFSTASVQEGGVIFMKPNNSFIKCELLVKNCEISQFDLNENLTLIHQHLYLLI